MALNNICSIINNVLGEFVLMVIMVIIAIPFSIGLIVLENKIKNCYENIGSKPFETKKLYHILSGIITVFITAVTVLIIEFGFRFNISESDIMIFAILVEFVGIYLIAETFFALYVYLKLKKYLSKIK